MLKKITDQGKRRIRILLRGRFIKNNIYPLGGKTQIKLIKDFHQHHLGQPYEHEQVVTIQLEWVPFTFEAIIELNTYYKYLGVADRNIFWKKGRHFF